MSVALSDVQLARLEKKPVSSFQSALDRRKRSGFGNIATAASSAIERANKKAAVKVTPEDIIDFGRRFPQITKKSTRTQISEMILDERRFPQGQIGPHDRPFLQAAKAAPAEFGGGVQRSAFNQAANIFQAHATVADMLGLPDLAADHRTISAKINEFGGDVLLGPQSREGIAATGGAIFGGIIPSIVSLVVSGGSSAPVLAYYAVQGFGAAGEEYDTVLKERGQSPDDIDRFAIAIGAAVIEIVSEKVSLDIIGRRLGPSLRKSIGDAFLRGKPGAVANALLKAEYISDVEAVEELVATFLNNALAANGIPFIVDGFDPDRPASENLLRSALQGKAGGAMLAPFAALSPSRLPSRTSQNVPTEEELRLIEEFLGESQAVSAPSPAEVRQDIALPVIAPTKSKPVDPAIEQTIKDLDDADRINAEDAALEVIADEDSSPEAKDRASQILDALDDSAPTTTQVGAEGQVVVPSAAPSKTVRDQFIKSLGLTKRRPNKLNITEKQALKNSLRAQKRVAEIVSRNVTKKLKDDAKAKRDIDKKTRKLVQRLIRSVVSRDRQGDLLRQVEGATPQTLSTVIDEIDNVVAQDRIDEQVEDAKRMRKKIKKAKRISNEARGIVLELIAEAEGRVKGDFGAIKTVSAQAAAKRKAAEEMNRDLNEAAEIFVEEVATNTDVIEGIRNETRENVLEVVSNINAPERDPLAKDISTSLKRRAIIEISDVRNLTRSVEGRKDDSSVLERLLWREMTRAENSHLLHVARRLRQMESAAKRTGFESLADAQAQLSGHGGEGVTQTVTVTIDGSEVTVPMGQAMWFTAIDQETEALLNEGASVVTREGLKQKGSVVSEEDFELERIRAQVPQNLQDFVAELKEIANQDTDELMDVLLELNGRQPRRVTDYFRRRRNVGASAKKGLPANFKEALIVYNENLGFTKEREGGTASPIIVEDFLTVIVEQINDTSKVLHIARPVRNASSVLLNPNVQTSINSRFGSSMNEALTLHLGAASLARTQRQPLAALIRAINGNVAVAKLGLNPSSMLRQLGGLPRLAPILGADGMADGLAGMWEVSMHDMTSVSGFFYDRYVSNISGRFGPVQEDTTFGKDRSGLVTTLDRAARNLMAGDVVGAYTAMRDIGLSTLEILNFFDSINARVAWAAFDARVKRQHPEWTRQKQLELVAEQASDAVRETQNSSSPLDLSTIALRTKGNVFSLWMLFSSDRFKTANRVRRAAAKGAASGAAAVTAELANIIWSVGVGRGVTLSVGLFVAFTLGDEDDVEEAIKRAVALDRLAFSFAVEGVNLVDPVLTSRFIETMTFNQADIFDTPASSSLNDLVKGIGQLMKATAQLSQGDQEKAISTFLRGIRDIGLEAGTLSGLNPVDTTMRRFFSAIDRLDDDEQSQTIAGR